MSTLTTLLGRGLQAAVGAVFAATAIAVLLTPRMPVNGYPRALALVTALMTTALVAITVWVARPHGPASPALRRRQTIIGLSTALLASIVAVIIAGSVTYRPTWDASVIRRASSTAHPAPYLQHYFGLYPNNIPVLGMARRVRAAGELVHVGYTSSFLVMNGLCLLVTLGSVYLSARWLVGHRAGMVALLVAFLLLGLSPWMIIGYTDIVTMALLTLAVCLLIAADRASIRARRVALALAACISLGASLVFKPMPIVVPIAVGIVVLVEVARRATFRRIGVALLTFAAGLGVCAASYVGLGAAARTAAGLDAHQVHQVTPATPLSFVAGGLLYGPGHPPSYGGYNGPLVERIRNKPVDETNRISWQVIEDQWHQRGLSGTARFEWDKQVWTWGDGTFWAYGEGEDRWQPVIAHTVLTPMVEPWDRVQGSLWDERSGLVTGLWCAVLLVLGVGLLFARYDRRTLALALSAIGIALLILVLQGRSRYVLTFVPIIVVLAGVVVGDFSRLSR
ncbi:hypothetical protein HJ588_06865 [Flexivirga sp. ID2601S]|uniref:Glycosyltransferase RgtA/B/C/D-like domain-containing protein n=1 Tax=Flexivirga aerilata TaxID=1656889 RepID=A0A849AQD8_9MICO|nr:glycosyltransferase family 39 protein [Flexivirga aerilata]NNG38992.1 hypothetical protein [Flexivirga aerilata]